MKPKNGIDMSCRTMYRDGKKIDIARDNRALVITDNERIFTRAQKEVPGFNEIPYIFGNGIIIKESPLKGYDLIISLHCRQIFPKELTDAVRCINVHPGYNPYNRGWYPHVFSLINGLPCGATIHEMDEKIDHGPIICQEMLPLKGETEESLYSKILDTEIRLLQKWLPRILSGDYETTIPGEGNINHKKDLRV